MRTKKGIVTSAGKITNTVTVTVTRYVVHPVYQKRYPVSKKFLADTNGQEVKEGYVVMIGECRPLSKKKHFKIVEVLEKGLEKGVSLEEELSEASGKKREDEKRRGGEEERNAESDVKKSEEAVSSSSPPL